MIPFIFLSGASDKINVRKGMELGADDYLTKPFTYKELLAAVNTRLEKQAEVKRQSDKKLDELRGNITLALPHELRTPLNGIMGLAALLMEDYATLPPEEVLESARYIHESALRLHRLIENFLVYSQMELMASESKKIETSGNTTPIEAVDVITEVAQRVGGRFQRDTDLSLRLTPCTLLVPLENFQKIVEELVDNAFKFSERGSPVIVSCQSESGRFTLTIADQGRGMTAEQVSEIAPHIQFERRTFEQQGAGLGLVIAKRMTELLDGQFLVDSRPGQGTVVRVSLPVPGV
jgi:signal transduction histidine kinase